MNLKRVLIYETLLDNGVKERKVYEINDLPEVATGKNDLPGDKCLLYVSALLVDLSLEKLRGFND